MELEQFESLEGKIEGLINSYSKLKQKNEELLEVIARKDEDIHRLREELEKANLERGRIGERIEALLSKIDGLGPI